MWPREWRLWVAQHVTQLVGVKTHNEVQVESQALEHTQTRQSHHHGATATMGDAARRMATWRAVVGETGVGARNRQLQPHHTGAAIMPPSRSRHDAYAMHVQHHAVVDGSAQTTHATLSAATLAYGTRARTRHATHAHADTNELRRREHVGF